MLQGESVFASAFHVSLLGNELSLNITWILTESIIYTLQDKIVDLIILSKSDLEHFLLCKTFFLSRGSIGNSLSTLGRGKVCVHPTVPRSHLWEHTGYVVADLKHLLRYYCYIYNSESCTSLVDVQDHMAL